MTKKINRAQNKDKLNEKSKHKNQIKNESYCKKNKKIIIIIISILSILLVGSLIAILLSKKKPGPQIPDKLTDNVEETNKLTEDTEQTHKSNENIE